MKTFGSPSLSLLGLFTGFVVLIACGKDDDSGPADDALTGSSFAVPVLSYAAADTIGEVVFNEHASGAVTAEVSLTAANGFSASIRAQSGLEDGDELVALEPLDGATGKSSSYLSTDDGATFTFAAIGNADAHINIVDGNGGRLGFADLGPNALTGNATSYHLFSVSDPNISGAATLYERKSGATLVAVRMENLVANASHPSHIHNNTAFQSGTIIINLANVSGATGSGLTHVEKKNDGTAVTYQDLTVIDGYIAVHKSASEISTLVGQGDIGKNAFTGREREYVLAAQSNPAISGTALFQERADNSTFVTISMQGTQPGKTHPAHIHQNSAAETGSIIIDFNNVIGGSGKSFTNLKQNNAGNVVTYDDLLSINGYINVHLGESELSTLIGQADIGQNALTGEQVVYQLSEVNGSGITGKLSLFERENGFSLAIVEMEGSLTENSYSTVIYKGSASATSPAQLVVLRSIGADRIGKNTIKTDKDGNSLTYTALIGADAHIRVLKNSLDLSTTVASANIGANSSARTFRLEAAATARRSATMLDAGIAACN